MRPITRVSIFGVRLGVCLLAAYWLTIFLGTHLPKVPNVAPNVSDKVKHFVAYFGLTILLCYVGNARQWVRRFGKVALIAIVYGAVDEYTQQLVPGRHADVMDFLADTAGVMSAIGVYVGLKMAVQRRPPANSASTQQ